ncbi:thiol-disulfide isomerase/thioredoxin [Chitinophaga dinghuensis]|uniref:Thiol-disulfide isomerase/thioredoxin n=2 Tax=Chitinophaga dinghuensis TaxID=1539050 RepID=A0A327VS01_9BACT|nr:thiol-disulfide isomerase/thioredoxin [Chitinophaga dinghuensis]
MEVNNDNLEKSDISTLMYQAEFLNIDSLPVSIPKSYLKDKNLLIDFWYIKCSPCLRKMVPLAAVKMRIGKTGTGEVILINDGSIDSFSTFKKAVSGLPKNLQYLYDVNGKLTKSVNVTGYPYEIVLHRGEVVRKLVGFNKGETDDLYIDEVLEMLNNKK